MLKGTVKGSLPIYRRLLRNTTTGLSLLKFEKVPITATGKILNSFLEENTSLGFLDRKYSFLITGPYFLGLVRGNYSVKS
jgi:hypothetical protein